MATRSEVVTFRATKEDKAALAEVSKLYGSTSPGHFVSEMTGAILSGDPKRLAGFLRKLTEKMGEQLVLDLQAHQAALQQAKEPAKSKKAKKGAGRRAKRV